MKAQNENILRINYMRTMNSQNTIKSSNQFIHDPN